MFTTCLIASLCMTAADPALTPATLYHYRGTIGLANRDGSSADAEKSFDLYLFTIDGNADGSQVAWLVDERGRGRFPWAERFGQMSLDGRGRLTAAPQGPSVYFDYGDGQSVVAIPPPVLSSPEALAVGYQWEDGAFEYEVEKAGKLGEVEAWIVRASNAYGRQQRLWIEKDSPRAIGIDQRVFMNMGTEYAMQLRFAAATPLAGEEAETLRTSFAALFEARQALGRQPRSTKPDLSKEELAAVQKAWERGKAKVTHTLLAKLATAIQEDLDVQQARESELSDLAKQFVALPAPEFALEDMSGEQKLSTANLANHVTVLHFWTYRDQPLEEPYGQVGYLDFLRSRPHLKDVQIYGVAVDSRLADGAQRSAALRSIRKFKSFMNLGFPVLLDDGKVLKLFGDPRRVGADLPLFVVIGPDGKVIHYQVGIYKVQRDRGLSELERVVSGALAK